MFSFGAFVAGSFVPMPPPTARRSPVVDGRKRSRRGSAHSRPLSTRGSTPAGWCASRLLQVKEDGSRAAERLKALGRMRRRALSKAAGDSSDSESDASNSDSDSRESESVIPGSRPRTSASAASKSERERRLVKSVRVEAQRDYLLALRSAVENPDLHQRILESQFLSTLLRLKKNPTRKRNGGAENSNAKPQGDLIVAALCSEVLGYICHSPHEEVLTNWLWRDKNVS